MSSSLAVAAAAPCRVAFTLLFALRALSLLDAEMASSPPSALTVVVPTRLPPPSLTAADFRAHSDCLALAWFFVLAISRVLPCRRLVYVYVELRLLLLC